MTDVIAPSRSTATAVTTPATAVAKPLNATTAPSSGLPKTPLIEFDSSNFDLLYQRTMEIQALASCVTCLTAVAAAGDGVFNGHLLIDAALPTLGDVIMRLAEESNDAGHALWEQLVEARPIANGKELQS